MSGDGPLHFTAGIDDKDFNETLESMERRMRGFTDTAVSGGQSVDKMIDVTLENLKIQKDVIADLESQLKVLETQISRTPAGLAQQELRKGAADVRAELEAEKKAMGDLESAVRSLSDDHVTFTTRLRQTREALAELELAGKQGTAEYRELQNELGRLTRAYKDVSDQAKALGSQRWGFDAAVQSIQGLTGALTAAQGAIGMFAGENENLHKIMLRVQSLMAVTIGLQSVQKALYKDSAFQIQVVGRVKQAYTRILDRMTISLWGSRAAAQALMATLTLGLSLAIGGAIVLLNRLQQKQQEEAQAQSEMFDKVAQSAAEGIARLEEFSDKWKRLGRDIQAQEKFVRDHSKAFDDLGYSVKTVADAEKILIDSKDDFIRAELAKAQVMAWRMLLEEKFIEISKKRLQLAAAEKLSPPTDDSGFMDSLPDEGVKKFVMDSPEVQAIQNELNKLLAEVRSIMDLSADAQKELDEMLRNLGLGAKDAVEGLIPEIDGKIKELRDKLRASRVPEEIAQIYTDIKTLEKRRSQLLGEAYQDTNRTLQQQLNQTRQLYQDYYAWIERFGKDNADKQFENLVAGGESYLQYLRAEIEKLEKRAEEGILSPDERDRLSTLEANEKDLIGSKTRMQALDEEIEQAKAKYTELYDYISFLNERIKLVPDSVNENNVAERARLEAELEKASQDYVANSRATFEAVLKETADFAEKRLLIEAEFQKRVKELDQESLGTENYQRAVEGLMQIRNQQLEEHTMQVISQSEAWQVLSGNIEQLTRTQAKAYLNQLREMVTQFGLSEDELKKILALLDQLGIKINKASQNKLANTLIDAANSLSQVSYQLDTVNSKLAQATMHVADIIGNLGNAQKSFAAFSAEGGATLGNAFGVFSAVYSASIGFAGLMNEITGYNKSLRESERRRVQKAKQLNYELGFMSRELERQLELLNEINDVDAFPRQMDALEQFVNDATAKLNDLSFSFANLPPMFRDKMTFNIDDLVDWSGQDDLREALESAFAGGMITQEQYDLALEYVTMIEDGTRRATEAAKEYQTLMLGTTSDALMSSIVEGFKQGKRSAEDFAETFEDLLRNAVLRGLTAKAIQGPLDSWLQSVMDTIGEDGTLTAPEIAALQQSLENNVLIPLELIGDTLGNFDLFANLQDADQLVGGIKGLTEQTGGVIAGQMTAIRMTQARGLEVMNSQLLSLNRIAENTEYNRYLRSIDHNLSELNEKIARNSAERRINQ